MLYLHLRLIQSALGQNAEAELVGLTHRERSQGRAAMHVHEVASFPGEMDLPLGWSRKRVTSFLAKFDLSASFATGRDAAHAVSGVLIAPGRAGPGECALSPSRSFKTKVRELTVRSQNLDAQLIVELNRVIQGTAHYFAPRWSTSRWGLRKLDEWLGRRLRCMKYKRFSYHDNRRMRPKQFERLGLLSLESFCQV